jgi:hypothetical protein
MCLRWCGQLQSSFAPVCIEKLELHYSLLNQISVPYEIGYEELAFSSSERAWALRGFLLVGLSATIMSDNTNLSLELGLARVLF